MRIRAAVTVTLAIAMLWALAAPAPANITFVFDYTYDSSGFFDPVLYPERREALDYAALYINRFTDDLAAIVPSGGNTWAPAVWQPDTGDWSQVTNKTVAADVIRVYVGARDLGGALAVGGPGGYDRAQGSPAWRNLVESRGETGALATPATDFGPWGGAISFNDQSAYTWYFGVQTGPPTGQVDFLSVTMHELAHVLGFGTSDSWDAKVSGTTFVGPASVASYGTAVPLDSVAAHWAEGTKGLLNGVLREAAMDPSIMIGTRKLFTELDFAGLADIGWQVAPEQCRWAGASSDRWDTHANWADGLAPNVVLTAVFDAAAPRQPQLYADQTVRFLDLATAGWTISGPGRTLTLGAGGLESEGAGTNVIAAGLALGADATLLIRSGNTLTVSGPLDLAGRTGRKWGAGRLELTGPQNHAAGSVLQVNAGRAVLAAPTTGFTLSVTVTGGVAEFAADQRLAGLTVSGGRAEAAAGGVVVVTRGLTIDLADAALDLADGALIIDYTGASPRGQVWAWLVSGMAGGDWDGTGLTSSAARNAPASLTALGLIDNADPVLGGLETFMGEPVDATSILVRYTWWGDVNLDGVVDGNDYDVIDNAFVFGDGGRGYGWWTGDFNGDGAVDGNDYDRIDNAFVFGGGPMGGAPAAVPEPATLALLAVAAGLARWRRRTR
jgi:hypothetical protein